MMTSILLNSFLKFNRYNLSLFLKNHVCISNKQMRLPFFKNDLRLITSFNRNEAELNQYDVDPYVCFKILRLIKGAVKESGPVLETNKKLSTLIERAEEYNVPYDFIDYSIKMAIDNRARFGLCEMLYLNQGYFIVQYEDIDSCNTKHHLMQLCEKYDAFFVFGTTKWHQAFHPKSIVCVLSQKSQPITDEKQAKQIQSVVGAESVKKDVTLNKSPTWQFHSAPENLHSIKNKLEEENCEVEEAYVGFVPKREIILPGPVKHTTHSMIAAMNRIPAIDNVYHNIML